MAARDIEPEIPLRLVTRWAGPKLREAAEHVNELWRLALKGPEAEAQWRLARQAIIDVRERFEWLEKLAHWLTEKPPKKPGKNRRANHRTARRGKFSHRSRES